MSELPERSSEPSDHLSDQLVQDDSADESVESAEAAAAQRARRRRVLQDAGAVMRLAGDSTRSITGIVEGVHEAVLRSLGLPNGAEKGRINGLTGFVYRSVSGIAGMVAGASDATLQNLAARISDGAESMDASPARDVVVSVLNGVMGDRLEQSNSPLAVSMTLFCQGKNLGHDYDFSLNPDLAVTPRLVVIIHGLCMNESQWTIEGVESSAGHAEPLIAAGWTPIYLRYNSGRHVSSNGEQLADMLDRLVQAWPGGVDQLILLGHSMGGLLARSAAHTAEKSGKSWRKQLVGLIMLGTPHHGAPLERVGSWLDATLASFSHTRPFTALGQLRSAGITDLRHGNVIEADWLLDGADTRFTHRSDLRAPLALPAGVRCFAIAGSAAAEPAAARDETAGDGLVPVSSALGVHRESERTLTFEQDNSWICQSCGHMKLLTHPEVTKKISEWVSTFATVGNPA